MSPQSFIIFQLVHDEPLELRAYEIQGAFAHNHNSVKLDDLFIFLTALLVTLYLYLSSVPVRSERHGAWECSVCKPHTD